MSLLGMAPGLGGGQVLFARAEMQAPDEARNYLARWFLNKTDATHMLFVDRDAVLHPDTPARLASWGVDIVGALAFTRYRPVVPTVYRGPHPDQPGNYQVQTDLVRDWIRAHPALWTWEPVVVEPRPDGALVEVDFTGAHCLLVSRRALEAVGDPWFRAYQVDPERLGEDRFFCEKASAAGLTVHVDLSVVAGHMYGEGSLGAADFLVWDAHMDWAKGTLTVPPPAGK